MSQIRYFDPEPLHRAARAYAKAVVLLNNAYDAHQKNYGLDEFSAKRVKTETRLVQAEQALKNRVDELKACALAFAGTNEEDR